MKIPEHRLCVYCGSATGHDPAFAAAANVLGEAIARAGFGLVYGGGGIGLMGEVARSVIRHGGHVTGIIPQFLVSKERMLEGVQELIVTNNMHERKMAMFERSSGFVALPGGIGTLEELAEILTWAQLQQHARPIMLLNIAGFWDPLLSLIAAMREKGFIRPGFEVRMDVVDSPDKLIAAYHHRLANTHDKPPVDIIKSRF
ncbi:MAG: TIGR00730 family Rossman fold protein [Proteobacteria bacterium]|nr:TIGR00730 family Rossman fold protein [Pseudomonadota bacterium]